MCGIVGYIGSEPIDTERLQIMCASMGHRGPDDFGLWFARDRTVGFAHRRLSIIDLSPGGHQPMTDGTGSIHITFNGEIYNYLELRAELVAKGSVFRTDSDTEVILEAYQHWGEGFVEHLDGMFALALFDETRRCVFLARDRAGEKPLFVWQTSQRIVFASELKAILALPEAPRRLDRDALEHYLAWGYVPRDLCIIEGMRKVPAATILRIDVDRGEITSRAYWELPQYSPGQKPVQAEELVDRLSGLLLDSVRHQMIADVPVGILLSGGVDSSLIVAMAARISSVPVKTFTVAFPGHATLDEAPYARIVASHFGTDHIELPAPEAEPDLLPMLMKQYDEPIADSSIIPTFLVSRLIRQHATVALGGDGGDELFGGYPSYVWAMRFARSQSWIPAPLRRAVAAAARRLPSTFRGRNLLLAFGEQGIGLLRHMGRYFSEEGRRALIPMEPKARPEEYRLTLAHGSNSILQAAQRVDFRSYMVDDILVKVDRASMLNSLELRAPFLDRSVVEFAFGSVPDELKVTLNERKILLRRLAQRVLPPELDLRRKQGFSIPIDQWIAGQWRDLIRDVLSGSDLFAQPAIESLFRSQASWSNQGQRLFALAAFELWRREYHITL